MALEDIQLGERITGDLVAHLKAQLGAETALVDAARADGITLAVPHADNYFEGRRLEGIGTGESPLVYVEVFVELIEPDDPHSDLDDGRAIYSAVAFVRLTMSGEDAETMPTVEVRLARYSVAIHNVFKRNPGTPVGGAAGWRTAVPAGVEYDREAAGGSPRKSRITVRLLCDLEED